MFINLEERMVEYEKLDKIFCKFYYPKKKVNKIIIAVHGFTGDKENTVVKTIAEAVERGNILVVSFDLPCHGKENDGDLRLEECFEYVGNIVEKVAQKYPSAPISLFATSFGAFLILNYIKISTYQFDHIILRSPAIFMDETLVDNILPLHHILLETMLEHKVNLSHEKEIFVGADFLKDLKTNSLSTQYFEQHIDIIQGDADDIVDFKKNEEYYKTNFSNYTLNYIDGGDHGLKRASDLAKIVEIIKGIMEKK